MAMESNTEGRFFQEQSWALSGNPPMGITVVTLSYPQNFSSPKEPPSWNWEETKPKLLVHPSNLL